MDLNQLVKAKNMDLLIQVHNNHAKELMKKGVLNTDESTIKKLKYKYENLLGRLDTDNNTEKNNNRYIYNIPIDSKSIMGIKGIKPTIKIRGKK